MSVVFVALLVSKLGQSTAKGGPQSILPAPNASLLQVVTVLKV
jgi:hypothetical protein